MPLKASSISSVRSHRTETKQLIVGLEFDQNKITAALIDDQANVVAVRQTETPQRTTRSAVAAMAKTVIDLAAAKERGASPIAAIGVAASGLVDPSSGRVSIAEMKGWTRVPLAQLLEENLDSSGHDIRTHKSDNRARAHHVESGHPLITTNSRVAALAAAESWVGSARGKNNVVYLSIGSEIEAGILINGTVMTGAGGLAGAAGWLAVTENFKAEYKSNGCLSAEAAMNAITRRAIEEWGGHGNSMLSGLIKSHSSELDAATIIRAARGGDKLAVKVVGETCRWLGRGAANLISILNPEAVVFGGEIGSVLRKSLDEIREEALRWITPEAARQCRFVSAMLKENASTIGAASLARMKSDKQLTQ